MFWNEFFQSTSFFLRFLVFEIWSNLYSTYVVNWDSQRFLRTWFRNANQWYLITSWLGGFNPKACEGWGRSPWWGVGRKVPHEPGCLEVRSLPNIIFFLLNSSQTNSPRILSTKSTISQKLKISKEKSLTKKSVSKHCASLGMNSFVKNF